MTFEEYQEKAMRTASVYKDTNDMRLNAVLGLVGEIGECAEIIKKHLFQGHDLKKSKLAEELGDVMWYVMLYIQSKKSSIRNVIKQGNRYYHNDMETFEDLHKELSRFVVTDEKKAITAKIISISFYCNKVSNLITIDELFKKMKEDSWETASSYLARIIEEITELGQMIGYPIHTIVEMNVSKLMSRYPSGFEVNKSVERHE